MSLRPVHRSVATVLAVDMTHDSRTPQGKSRVSGGSSCFPSGYLNNESFDLNSETDHVSANSSTCHPAESYHLLLPRELQTPAQHFTTPEIPEISSHSPLCSALFSSVTEMQHQSVLEVGVASDQGIRSSMEDEHVTVVEPEVCFFGIYDGHGGRQCAEYVRARLHEITLAHECLKTDPRKAISDAFAQVEREFLGQNTNDMSSAGCVCAAAVVQGSVLTVGNVGDCEVVLARAGQPVLLTVKHNPSCNDAEATRVKKAGGCIFNCRVGHPRFNPRMCSLAVSRAVGDAGFKLEEYTNGKPSGIIAVADTSEVLLAKDDEFLILACDGLWDTMSYAEAVELATAYMASGADANSVADQLVGEALRRGTRDNVTAIFVRLGGSAQAGLGDANK
ncbi:protein phosphatase 2C-like protein [Leishmania major strain Friedlin]|uniref:Protein phosphatase 2C-like protein n=1 Tax=Leishmania major TaxID=5664 RepID=Q4Q2U6_LEIMA|nr:protein phosphatase 2C-like protein [Leishmania major strain Friedlin]CAG9582126.1 protein_phosphatase_2C-like_protein [Leishmania major strain Friedlin]CAJ07969.1 protein phosphatase 2C-like protein [Leishmania major strain Friedlin]|eukprot:XP_001686352.1 protein phosphatase 2C-like protein [Leishmania major strain Friedlin]